MTVLVTGATGLIGSAVVDALLAAGERVAAVTRDDPRFAWMLEASPDLLDALGRPGRPFREWVADHAAAVRMQ